MLEIKDARIHASSFETLVRTFQSLLNMRPLGLLRSEESDADSYYVTPSHLSLCCPLSSQTTNFTVDAAEVSGIRNMALARRHRKHMMSIQTMQFSKFLHTYIEAMNSTKQQDSRSS